ncbi:MAG: TIGR02117 family protein [Pseudomonadota bacterium]
MTLRYLRALAAIPGVILAYLVAAVVGAFVPGPVADIADQDGPAVEIGLISGPIHVDFLLPATDETRAALGFARSAGVPVETPWVEHIIIGWGARDFYTSAGTYADMRAGPVWRAITGDRSVLRVDVFGPIAADADYARLSLSAAQYSALLAAIAETATETPVPEASFTPTDGFVEAVGRFHIYRTCNTWVSRMLREAGVAMGIWTPTPYSVHLSLARL